MFLHKHPKSKRCRNRTTRSYISLYCISLGNIFTLIMAAAKYVGAGLAAIGLTGAGIGIGSIFSSLISSTARNPALRGQLFTYAILGFALAEATGLFALMVSFLVLYS